MVAHKNETILFAEDDKMIRNVTTTILEKAGYKVYSAENGELAYNLGLQHLKEIDILLTDIKMPKINGEKLTELLIADKPELKVVFSSAFIKSKTKKIEINNHKILYLIKPYSMEELLTILKEL